MPKLLLDSAILTDRRKLVEDALATGIAYGIDMSQECWRDVDEANYEVSNFGQVRSKPRTVSSWNGSVECTRLLKVRYLKPDKCDDLYAVKLRINGQGKTFLVARLVLTAFVGPCPEGMEACHYPDSNRANNRLDNLRWDTSLNNQQDRIIHGATTKGRNVNAGEANGGAKVTIEMVREMRRLYSTGVRQVAICKMFGLSGGQVCDIVHGRAWKE